MLKGIRSGFQTLQALLQENKRTKTGSQEQRAQQVGFLKYLQQEH